MIPIKSIQRLIILINFTYFVKCAGENCFVEENKILIGFVYGVIGDVDNVEQCANECTRVAQCRSGTYFYIDRMCVLNSADKTAQPTMYARSHPEITVYFHGENCEGRNLENFATTPDPREKKSKKCLTVESRRFTNNVRRHSRGKLGSFDECNRVCAERLACRSGVYYITTQECALYYTTRDESLSQFRPTNQATIYFEGVCPAEKKLNKLPKEPLRNERRCRDIYKGPACTQMLRNGMCKRMNGVGERYCAKTSNKC